MTLRTSGLPLLLGLCLAGLFLLGAGPMDRASRAETRAWKQVEQAVQQNAPQRLLDRAEEYLRSFPDGLSSTEAHRLAGEAAMQLELWTACRRHFDSYLAGGGRSDIAQVSWQIAICLAREGPSEEARVALRNVAANDPDPERAASAGREADASFAGWLGHAPG